jgi:predicted transcriptional regulator
MYEKVRVMLVSGYTQQEIGDELGITKQRVSQIRKKYFSNLGRKEWGASKRKVDKLQEINNQKIKTRGKTHWKIDSDFERATREYFSRKKQNAKGGKYAFEVEYADLFWPTVCPVLDIPIDWFAPVRNDNSPSMDRIDPRKGYIPGNVAIVSWRANRIKNNGTAEEHQKIAEWILDKMTKKAQRNHCK